LGEGIALLPQLVGNILIAAASTALVAVGFAVIYSTARFFHFAHGVVFASGAYFAYLFSVILGLPLWVAGIIAVLLAGALGAVIDIGVYRQLRKRGATPMVLLLASLGLYIALQNVISMIFGDDTKSIRTGEVKEGMNILGARITPIQLTIIITSVFLIAILHLFTKKTKLGKLMRAVANDPNLASASGVNSNRILLWVFMIGSCLAGVAGLLVSLDIDMTPTMGMNPLMMAVVVVVIGGTSSFFGIASASFLIESIKEISALLISSQWMYAISFFILLLFMYYRHNKTNIVNYY
jgi:branched-chain amino acid transport system permease protein